MNKCEAGCQRFYGGEIRHHKDCIFYPESFTEMYDKLEKKNAKMIKYLIKHARFEMRETDGLPGELVDILESNTGQKIREII